MTPPPALDGILRDVRRRADERRTDEPLEEMRLRCAPDPARRKRFIDALRSDDMAIIAEIKRRSPSAGLFTTEVDVLPRAKAYASGGAAALSVLTERDHFSGSIDDLRRARGAGSPILRKDFVLDEGMVLESHLAGADAILLIVACLGDELEPLRRLAGELGLAVVIEVHGEAELDRAVAATPECIGVNARDLLTFEVDTRAAWRLLGAVPSEFIRVAESGLRTVDDLRQARRNGADAALVGEALMESPDPVRTLSEWRRALGGRRRFPASGSVKVCGLTSVDSVSAAVDAGATAVGFIDDPSSPRAIGARDVGRIVEELPEDVTPVGVFVDRTRQYVEDWCRSTGVTHVQLCGNESAAEWRGFGGTIVRRVAVVAGADSEMDAWGGIAAGFLLDHPAAAGGSGRLVDFAVARRLAARGPCLLAGGLDGDNVAQAIEAVRPLGVDASSRLESAPGVKDPELVKAFVKSGRSAIEEVRP